MRVFYSREILIFMRVHFVLPNCSNRYYKTDDLKYTKNRSQRLSREIGLSRVCRDKDCILLNCRQEDRLFPGRNVLCMNPSCESDTCFILWKMGIHKTSYQTFCTRDLGSNKDVDKYISDLEGKNFCHFPYYKATFLGIAFSSALFFLYCYMIFHQDSQKS